MKTCQSKFLLGSQKLIFRFLSMPLLGLSAPQARTVQSCEFHSPSHFIKCAAGSFFQNDSSVIRDHRERSRRPRIFCFRTYCARQKNSEKNLKIPVSVVRPASPLLSEGLFQISAVFLRQLGQNPSPLISRGTFKKSRLFDARFSEFRPHF